VAQQSLASLRTASAQQFEKVASRHRPHALLQDVRLQGCAQEISRLLHLLELLGAVEEGARRRRDRTPQESTLAREQARLGRLLRLLAAFLQSKVSR